MSLDLAKQILGIKKTAPAKAPAKSAAAPTKAPASSQVELAKSILSKAPAAPAAAAPIVTAPRTSTDVSREAMRKLLMSPVPEKVIDLGGGIKEIHLPTGEVFRQDASGKPVKTPRAVAEATKKDLRGGKSFQDSQLEIDHLIPKALGGTDDDTNLRAAKSQKTLSQSAYDFLTGNKRLPGEYKPENRQEGKMVVEWEAINQYKAGKISVDQARAAVSHSDNPEFVGSILGGEFGEKIAPKNSIMSKIGDWAKGAVDGLMKATAQDILAQDMKSAERIRAIQAGELGTASWLSFKDSFSNVAKVAFPNEIKLYGLKKKGSEAMWAALKGEDDTAQERLARRRQTLIETGVSADELDNPINYLPTGYQEPDTFTGAAIEGAKRFYYSVARTIPGTMLEIIGRSAGSPELSRIGENVSDAALAKYVQRPELLAGERASKPLLEGGWKDKVALGNTIGEMVPFALTSIATSVVGGLVAGPPGALIGGAAVSASVEASSAYNQMIERGIAPADAAEAAQAYGAIAAILENSMGFKPSSIASKLVSGKVQRAATTVVKNDFKSFLVRELPKHSASYLKKIVEEGEEESMQQFAQNLITKWQDESQPLWENVAESFAQGAVGSLGFLPADIVADVRASTSKGKDPVNLMIGEAVNEVKGKLESGVVGEQVVVDLAAQMPVDTAKALVEQAQTELREESTVQTPAPVVAEAVPAPVEASAAKTGTKAQATKEKVAEPATVPTVEPSKALAKVAEKMTALGAKVLDKTPADIHGDYMEAQDKVQAGLEDVRARIKALEDKATTVKGAERKAVRQEITDLQAQVSKAEQQSEEEFLVEAGHLRSQLRQRVKAAHPTATDEQVSSVVDDVLNAITDGQNAAALATRSVADVADVMAKQALGNETPAETPAAPVKVEKKAKKTGKEQGVEKSTEKKTVTEKSKTATKEELKVGDVFDTGDKTNMASPVKIREIIGNSISFTDAEGQEYSGMARSTVMAIVKGGSWKRVTAEATAIDKSPKSGNDKVYEKPDNDSGSGDQPKDDAKPDKDSGEQPGGSSGTTPKPGESGGRDVSDGGREPGERSATRLTNEEIDAVLSGITEIGADGEVKLTGPVTDNIREAANQFKTGGVAKEGRGILDEYYTSSTIVDMVKSILKLPQTPLKVLEPSVGSGNFLYALPEGSGNDVRGMEVNPISAKIAKVFHENAKIFNAPFESLFMDKNGKVVAFKADYDLVIGNPPYGDHRGFYKGLGEESKISRYEEYFIKRGLNLLKPGGKLVMVIPSGFLRSKYSDTKETIAESGKLLSAWRLPSGVFDGTEVGTDIVVFTKDPTEDKSEIASRIFSLTLNNFFSEFPSQILGIEKERKDRFGKMEKFIEGSIDDAVSIFNSITSLQAMEMLKKTETPATPVNVESAQAGVEEAGDKNAEKLLKEAAKKGKEIIAKTVKKTTSKKGKIISLASHYEGQFTEQEVAYWKATKSDGSIDTALLSEPDGEIVNFMGGKWYVDFNYLQGDIYEKLETLESEKQKIGKEQYARQKAKLEAILPKPETSSNIKIAPNAQFVATLEITDADGEKVLLRKAFLDWMHPLPSGAFGQSSSYEVSKYVINEQVRGNDKEMNEAIRTRRKVVADRLFSRFIREELSDENRKKFEDSYNRTFNFFYTPDYKKVPMFADIHATFQGDTFKPTDTQKHGIGRLVNTGGGILAHEVGFGKTISGILSVHEMMTRGWVKKPVLVVPSDQLVKQWTHTLNELVPNAKVNVLGNLGASFQGDLASLKIEDGSWTFLTYEGLERLSFKDETYDKLSNAFAYIGDDLNESRNKRDAEKAKARAEETGGKMRRGARGDLFFEDLGFDHFTMDEAHNANHIVSKVKLEKGQASEFNQFSQKTSNLGIKTWITAKFIQDAHEGRNVTLLTATPFTNHPLEYYSMLSLVADKALARMGAYNVNEFFGMFMEAESQYEFKADEKYQKKTDVRKIRNLRQWNKLLESHIDFKTDDPSLVRPERTKQNYEIPQNDFGKSLEDQAQSLFKDKKNAGTLRAIGELRKIAFSPFASIFYQGAAPSYKQFVEESPKIKTLMALIGQNLKDKSEAGQIVYLDNVGIGFMPDMKQYLVKEMGLKADEVEIISGATPKAKRPDIQDRFNAGKVKILLGSEAIKEGMNLQKNSTDLYILSLPWNFTQLRQVIGRLWRQGNNWKNVRINNLFIQDSIDVFLSQKLDNKQKRYEAGHSSTENEVDVGDVDYNELKFQLVKDPTVRAKLELTSEVEQINQVLDQQKSELAFVTKKAGVTELLKEDLQNSEENLAQVKSHLDKARPDEVEYLQGRLGRYQRQLESAQKKLADHQEALKARGLTDEILAEKKVALEKEVADLDAKKKAVAEQFDQRVKDIAASMPVPVQFSDKIVSQFVADRAEQNKTFYQLREQESQTTIAPVETTKEIKNASGTKVLETKKIVRVQRKASTETKAAKEDAALSDKTLTVSQKVDALLAVKQEGKDFKDVGERVAGSKKERAAIVTVMQSGDQSLLDEMVLRLGVETVADVVNKDKILENTKKPDPEQDKKDGVPSLIAFVKKDILNKIPKVFSPIKKGRGRFASTDSSVSFNREGVEGTSRSTAIRMDGDYKLIIAEAFGHYPALLREFVEKLANVKSVAELAEFWTWYKDTYQHPFGGRSFPMGDQTLFIDENIFGFGMSGYKMPSLPGKYYGFSPGSFATQANEAGFNAFVTDTKWWDKAMGKREKSDVTTDTSHGNFVPMEDIRRTAPAIPAERVKAETLQTDLGFKSVQFGNYMDDVTSREHIRHTIGAIEDIGTALDLNIPKIISDLGLSIAFGARGGSKALAHFEPTRTIINLTKGKGDGSLFHEFFHFLDFTYPKVAKSYRGAWSSLKERYYRRESVDPASLRLLQTITGKNFRTVREFKPGETDENVQAEVKKLYDSGVSAEAAAKEAEGLNPAWKRKDWLQDVADMYRVPVSGEITVWNEDTQYLKDSKSIGGDYWSRPEELLARASQAYIEDKMAEKGLVNDYVTRSTVGHKAYPQGEERVRFNKAFDDLFTALREKYARGGEAPKFKVSDEKPRQTMTEAAKTLQGYKDRLGIDFDVQFVDSILVGSDPAAFARMNGRVQGVTVDNTIVLLKEMAARTAEHEVVHVTLKNLDRIEAFRSEGITLEKVMEGQAENMGISLIGNERKVEEALAEGFEKYVPGQEAQAQGIVRKFFATLKRLLLRFVSTFRASKGDIVQDYYDVLQYGRSVDAEMVRLENKGIVDAFIEDGAFTIEDMETFGVAQFKKSNSLEEFLGSYETLYHGTADGVSFDKFDPSRAGKGVGSNSFDQGDQFYLTETKGAATFFADMANQNAAFHRNEFPKLRGGKVLEFLMPKDAKVLEVEKMPRGGYLKEAMEVINEAKAQGYDAVRFVDHGFDTVEGVQIVGEQYELLGRAPKTTIVLNPNIVFTMDQLVSIWEKSKEVPVSFKLEPTDSAKEDKRLAELADGFDKAAALVASEQAKMEAWFNSLAQSVGDKEVTQASLAETPAEIKALAKFTKRTPPVGSLTKRGQQEVVAQFADPKAAEEQLSDYLKRKTELIETRNRLRQLRKDIAQARKDKKTNNANLRDLERRLRLRKEMLERNDHYIDLGRIRGKREGIQFVMKRKSAIYQIAGSVGITNKDIRDLVASRHFETMTEADFNDYLIRLSNRAGIVKRTGEMQEQVSEFIKEMDLRNTNNLRLAMGLPNITKMTLEQSTRFFNVLSGYQLGDTFLSKRELETIHRTEWGDVKTAFELVSKLEQHMGMPKGRLSSLVPPGEWGEVTSWLALSRKHPFFKYLVDKRMAASITATREAHEMTEELFVLANEARKSRSPKLSLKERLVETVVPTDDAVAGYIESPDKQTHAAVNKMTAEEIAFADRYIAMMHQIYEYLQNEYGTPERQNYMTHMRRTFLETIKDDGIKKAVGEVFATQREDEAAFTILAGKTGEILAFEKFMGNLLQRKGVIVPSRNVARVAATYIRAFTKKKALDAFVPDIMLTMHAHQLAFGPGTTEKGVLKDTRLDEFVKAFLNDAKGRKIDVTGFKQGSKKEIALAGATKLVRLKYLGFSLIGGFLNIVGDIVAANVALGPVKTVVALKRTILNPVQSSKFGKSQQAFTGNNPILELWNPDKNIVGRVLDAALLLFGWTAYLSERFYQRGVATKEEFETTVMNDARLQEITRELSKWKATKFYIPSLLGSTTFGKAGSQFNTWAFPIFNTALSGIKEYYASFKNKRWEELKPNGSEHAKDLAKLVSYIMVTSFLVALMPNPDDDDKSIWAKARRKVNSELNTLSQAMMNPLKIANYFPVLKTLIEAGDALGLILSQEKYQVDGEGFVKGDKKWIKATENFLTPSALKQLSPPKERESTRDNLLEEAAQTGDFDGEAIGKWLNPEKWAETGEQADKYRATTIANLTVEYNAMRKYPGSKVVDAIRSNAKNADRIAELMHLANDVGIDVVASEMLELREDADLYTNPDSGTGALVSSNLYEKFQEAVDAYKAAK